MRVSLLVIAWLGVLAGCSSTSAPVQPRPATVTAGGVVSLNGQPIGKATVLFFRQSPDSEHPGLVVSATTDDQGRFILGTYAPGDGAPVGKYAVTVTWNVPKPGEKAKGTYEGPTDIPDRLDGKYANPKTTPLNAEVTATGPNQFEFALDTP